MKEFLSQNGVPWAEKMVDLDRAAAIEMIRRSGQQGVPVTVIGDEVIVGFDRPRLARIVSSLKAKGSAAGQAGMSTASNGRRSLGAKVADAGRYTLPAGTAVAGAYVGSVNPDSPAASAGLKSGDVIISVGDQSIASVDDLTSALGKLGPGPVDLKVARGPDLRTVTVNL